MINFSNIEISETKYYYIYCKYDDAVVHLPLKEILRNKHISYALLIRNT